VNTRKRRSGLRRRAGTRPLCPMARRYARNAWRPQSRDSRKGSWPKTWSWSLVPLLSLDLELGGYVSGGEFLGAASDLASNVLVTTLSRVHASPSRISLQRCHTGVASAHYARSLPGALHREGQRCHTSRTAFDSELLSRWVLACCCQLADRLLAKCSTVALHRARSGARAPAAVGVF